MASDGVGRSSLVRGRDPEADPEFSMTGSILRNLEKEQCITKELLMVLRRQLSVVLKDDERAEKDGGPQDRHGASTELARQIRDRLEFQQNINRALNDLMAEVEL